MTRRLSVRSVLVVAIAVPLIWVSFAVSYSLANWTQQPALAAKIWPGNSLARAKLADQLATVQPPIAPSPAALPEAIASLGADPGNPEAARVIGTLKGLAGDESGLLSWLTYSEEHSRRDLATQLMLIETAVNRGQVAGALAHYDRALRVFAPQPGLVNILVTATDDPNVRPQLADLLRRNPPWRQGYLIQLVESGHAAPQSMYTMIHSLQLNSQDPFERRILGEAVASLARGHLPLALALAGGNTHGIRNGNFDGDNAYPPIDWALTDTDDLTGVIESGTRNGGGNALFLEAHKAGSGTVAEQLMALTPGHYVLSLIAGDGASNVAEAPVVILKCVDREGNLASISLATGSNVTRRFRQGPFLVPANCPAQSISFVVAALGDSDAVRPWIDDIEVRRVP